MKLMRARRSESWALALGVTLEPAAHRGLAPTAQM